jgi:hypothetical protein
MTLVTSMSAINANIASIAIYTIPSWALLPGSRPTGPTYIAAGLLKRRACPSSQRAQNKSPSGTAARGCAKHSRCHLAPHPSQRSILAAPLDFLHFVHAKSGGGTATLGSIRPSMSGRWHGAHRSTWTRIVRASAPSSSRTSFSPTARTRRTLDPALVSSVSSISRCR